jgi:hypothetical protein
MNKFWFPRTSFHDPDYEPVVYEFETTEDLLALEPVRKHNSPGAEFVISDGLLMVITKDGFEWWVVGRIEKPEEVNLPQWKGWKFLARLGDGTETVLSSEVYSICGDLITLKDGSTATRIKRAP